MATIISKLPVTPPAAGVRPGSLMHTVRLSGAYQADIPIILPSYTRLVTMDALPYKLCWTAQSAVRRRCEPDGLDRVHAGRGDGERRGRQLELRAVEFQRGGATPRR